MRTRSMTAALVRITAPILLSALIVTDAHARGQQEVAVRVSADYAADSGLYATGSSKTFLQAELGYAHTVRQWRRAELWVEGSWTIGERHDTLFDQFNTSLLAQSFTAGARGTFPVRRWFVPQIRGGLGAQLGTLKIGGLQAGDVEQTQPAFTAYIVGGVQFLLPAVGPRLGRRVTFGLSLEGGYVYSTPMRYSARPASSPDTVQMPSQSIDLGAISLSGGVFRAGVLLRF